MPRKSVGKKRDKQKVELVFDENARRSYLTGFKKRKQERREVAANKFELRFKKEKNRIKNEKRSAHLAEQQGPTVLPDNMLISDVTTVTHELPDHTVSVAEISEIDLHAGGLGLNRLPTSLDVDTEQGDPAPAEDEAPGMEMKKVVPTKPPPDEVVSERSRQNIMQTKQRLLEKKNKQKNKNLQKHKSRVRKKNMKLNHQLKRQKKGKSL